MMTKSCKVRLSIELKPHSKIWLQRGNEYAFGGGIAEILGTIHKTGSIKKAALLLGESYRYVWGRIQKTEEVMGIKLIETTVGGQDKARSALTDFAFRILNPYMRFEANIQKQINSAYRKMMKEINKAKGEKGK